MAPSALSFNVIGDPASQGSKIPRVSSKGKPYVQEQNSEKHDTWRGDVITAANRARKDQGWDEPAEGPVEVHLWIRVPRPKSVSIKHRPYPHTRPDVDKMARAILDALTIAGVWRDDAQVITLHAIKRYATDDPDGAPGVSVRVLVVPNPMII